MSTNGMQLINTCWPCWNLVAIANSSACIQTTFKIQLKSSQHVLYLSLINVNDQVLKPPLYCVVLFASWSCATQNLTQPELVKTLYVLRFPDLQGHFIKPKLIKKKEERWSSILTSDIVAEKALCHLYFNFQWVYDSVLEGFVADTQ